MYIRFILLVKVNEEKIETAIRPIHLVHTMQVSKKIKRYWKGKILGIDATIIRALPYFLSFFGYRCIKVPHALHHPFAICDCM